MRKKMGKEERESIDSFFKEILEETKHTPPTNPLWGLYWGILNCFKEFYEEERDLR